MDGIEARFASGEHPDDPVAHPVLLDVQNGFYARCEPATARTRVGEMDYHACASVPDPGRLDESVSQAFRSWGRAALARRVPWYADAPEAGTLAGMYTLSPDAQALLGPLPAIEGLYVCAGFSGHGFKLAPSVGEGMAQMMLGEPVSAFDTAFFSPGRFAGGVRAGSRAFGL
jgi:glycine/D-amino acid oxidase-like deaminating enzyme